MKSHQIKTSFTPPQKISAILPSVKDSIDSHKRKGAIYQIPCKNCNKIYIGETGRCFQTRQKEHKADVKKESKDQPQTHRTALSKHAIAENHNFDWDQSKILQFETDYHKRKFIETYYINKATNAINDKSSVQFSFIYN